MKEQNPSLMPPMFEPVERKLLDAFRARASGEGGGVEAAYSAAYCRNHCDAAPSYERTYCMNRCQAGYLDDYFGITSCTVK